MKIAWSPSSHVAFSIMCVDVQLGQCDTFQDAKLNNN